MRPLHYYLLGTGSWFLAFGIQGVMFAWLVTMVLHETPEKVGIAQMSLLLPGTVLILIGGSYADRFGARRMALLAQAVAMLAPAMLLWLVAVGQLSFTIMIGYAVLMGFAQAFVTPARDGLLSQVAEGRVQRTVMLTSMIQFGLQVVGFLVASLAEGSRTVASSPAMRMILVQNMSMALFFMGSYIVTMPLLVREAFAGDASDLAQMNASNSLGLVTTIILLLRLGDVHRQGRALVVSQALGALVLGAAAFAPAFPVFLASLFVWGLCGGVAMTMSRTIMQEQAPMAQRSRVMSFYSFSFMGAGPVGALLNGYLVEVVGPRTALLICALAMFTIMLVMASGSGLWRLRAPRAAAVPAPGAGGGVS